MNLDRIFQILAVTVVCLVGGCQPAPKTTEKENALSTVEIAPKSPQDLVAVQLAVYLPDAFDANSRDIASKIIGERKEGLQILNDFPTPEEVETACVVLKEVDTEEYAPPDADAIKHFGRGLNEEQAESLQDSKKALILVFLHQREQAWPALLNACAILEEIGRDTDGMLWDGETRLVFTPDAWREEVLAGDKVSPCISDHVTIHAYRDGDHVRAITLGMSKFGLPDVVVEEIPASSTRSIGNMMNAFCQVLAEGARFRCPGDFDLDLKSIRNEKMREKSLMSLGKDAKAFARLQLQSGKVDEGDPENDLIELRFDRYEGPDAFARQMAALSELFGSTDEAEAVSHNEAILAASKQARAKLPELQKAFEHGLKPGEYLLVKAPFETSTGNREWMWVEISNWREGEIVGTLQNDPVDVPEVHAGQKVSVNEADVFDYIRIRPDGTKEGNETGKAILEANQ
jgi:uncharacterized protein YegJ (DUF2314 family)